MTPPAAPVLLAPFPAPPQEVRLALLDLQVLSSNDREAIAELGDVDDLPRPWDPAGCPPGLRRLVWQWCDGVATWVNGQYAWRPALLLPACWPAHPHIAGELPVLACLRHAAGHSSSPELLEQWHRHTLPLFLERVAARLGESSCRTGHHQDWPAAARFAAGTDGAAMQARHELFDADCRRG